MPDIDETLPLPEPGPQPPAGGQPPRGDAPLIDNGTTRYQELEELGAGGMGRVLACLDPSLGRTVALKILHPHFQKSREYRARFVREAQVMAHVEHPSIVPVHELGARPDGSLYFTMKRVKGLTLERMLRGLKENDSDYVAHYPLARRLDILLQVCQAMAFAHSHGVLHRDLKPANILIGAFGEVLVLDWGLAKRLDDTEEPPAEDRAAAPPTAAQDRSDVTREGRVAGTPLYMSPEQAAGRVDALDRRSDLYSLGAILYEMLTLEHTVTSFDLEHLLEEVVSGTIEPPRHRRPDLKIPRELDAICMKALAKRPEQRYAGVLDLIADLERYRAGLSVSVHRDALPVKAWKLAKRHPLASSAAAGAVVVLLVVIASLALARSLRYTRLMAEADRHREEGNEIHARKVETWRRLDRLRQAIVAKEPTPAELALDRTVNDFHRASENQYEIATALYMAAAGEHRDERRFTAMREIYTNRLDFALMRRDYLKAEQILHLLREWVGADFERAGPARARLLAAAASVQGNGSLRVETRPPGAAVTLETVREGEGGYRIATDRRTLGPTPAKVELPPGDYLVTLTLAGRPEVRYPVRIDHGENESAAVFLPAAVPDGTVYVPAGAYYEGGENSRHYRLHERMLPGFFVARHEVTFGEFLAYWRANRAGPTAEQDRSFIRFERDERRFTPAWDDAGKLMAGLDAARPVVGITREAAERYCAWLGRQRGVTCRLPTAEEWTKAARGVDGRVFPWGDRYDPGFAFTSENTAAREKFGHWAPPGSFPRDVSPYGALDMGGNVREWTGSKFPEESPFHQIKGASASTTRRFLPCAYASDTPVAPSDVGFRYVIELVENR